MLPGIFVFGTGQMSAAEIGLMSVVETRQKLDRAVADISLVSTRDISLIPAGDSNPASATDIRPFQQETGKMRMAYSTQRLFTLFPAVQERESCLGLVCR